MLNRSLTESGRFEIDRAPLPKIPATWRFRRNFHWIRLQGATIGVDTWDRRGPLDSGHPILDHADLILKIQHRPHPFWRMIEQRHTCRISSWTMFGYEGFPCESFQWRDCKHNHLYCFSGSAKRPKRKWLTHMKERGMPVFGVQSVEEYMPLLRETRWGVVLKGDSGPHCDGKNRREPAFASLGLPLALNYQPHYPFPMQANRDFSPAEVAKRSGPAGGRRPATLRRSFAPPVEGVFLTERRRADADPTR